MAIRISGLASGLDTESIVSALVSAYDYKKEKYVKAQTKLSWKQDAWKSLNTKIYSLYSGISNMRYTSNYQLKKTTVSDSTKATVTASSTAINGTSTLRINQLAKTGYITGAELDDDTTEDTTLVSLGYSLKSTTGNIQIKANGESKMISVSSTTTISDFVDELNDAGVKASYDATNHRLFVSATSSGADNDFSMTAQDQGGLEALSSLGLLTSTDISTYTGALFTETKDTDGNLTAVTSSLLGDSIGFTVSSGKVTEMTYDADSVYSKVSEAATKLRSAYVVLAMDSDKVTSEQIAQAKEDLETYKDWDEYIGYSEDEWLETTASEATNSLMSRVDTAIKLQAKTYGATLTTTNTTHWDSADELAVYTTNSAGTYYDSSTTASNITGIMSKIYSAYETIKGGDDGDEDATETKIENAKNFLSALTTIQNASDDDDVSDALSTINTVTGTTYTSDYVKKLMNYLDDNGLGVSADADSYSSDTWYGMSETGYTNYESKITSAVDQAAAVKTNNLDIDSSFTGTRVVGEDAEIVLNNATFTSASNSITVNGLTIQATGVTDGDISITTDTDTSGLYDKVKDFLTQYNSVINEMMELYNADSASDYEPLTDDEKAEMSDTEIEKWEQKIKDSLLRRDTTLSSLITSMTTSMMNTVEINGKNYSWYDFGISTLGYLNSEENENYAYHIDGDSEDSSTSGNEDKLNAALASDPDTVIEFLKQATSNLYSAIDKKMKSTAVSSVYTVYNDKEMASEYSDYTTLIKTWTTRVSDLEESYYSKFAAMESALATLQSNSSSISSLLG